MQYDFIVIGANGVQGKIVAKDLLENGYSVLLAAVDDYGLDHLIDYKKSDFALLDLEKIDRAKRIIKKAGASIIINCAIDDFNFTVTKLCLDIGVNYLDLGSEEKMTYDQFALSEEFKAKNIIAITGVGSTPGITNVMLRYIKDEFDTIESVQVGFAWESNISKFVVPFSIDAISCEFSESAKVFENGQYVEKMPEDCKENFNYRGLQKQKTLFTKHIEHHTFYEFLKDKGIKNIHVYSSFPQHSYNAIKTLIDLGFTKKDKIEFQGNKIKPLDFTSEILRRINLPENYKEKEVLWLKVFGKKNNMEKNINMEATAETLAGWEDATCNIDTGMPASIIAQMIKNGKISEKGVFPPEFIVPPEPFFEELSKRNILIYKDDKLIN
jgi:saccharopine dehydrogenase-like NADP-dependent oxidoreductase